ncbi:MAG: hypothetical protein JKY12_09515 [Sneathiella sp.]|nr:hypothetical protein [Sneathiella sp.]
MAQGACLALEDALVLGNILSHQNNWENMANLLTESRKGRVLWALDRNRRREKLTDFPYWISSLRLKLVGQKTWIEDYAPLAVPLNVQTVKRLKIALLLFSVSKAFL